MTYKRKKYHVGDTHLKKRWRVRNRKKDLDQIDEDIKEENADKLLAQKVDLDLPGAAQHYCLHCARYFVDAQALNEHFKTKVHKRRLKALELEPYSIEESERAAGHGNFKQAAKRKIVSQNVKDVKDEDGDTVLEETMLRNILVNIVKDCKLSQVRHSALFINGAKATEQFVYVKPHVDTPELLKHKENIQEQLNKRNLTIDLDKIENLWAVYEELKSQKSNYEKKKTEISQQLGKLNKSDPDGNETKKLKIQIDLVKDNIKKLKIPLWSAEEAAMIEALKLPNNLHTNTPTGESNVLFAHLSCPNNKKNHLQIGKDLNLIKFKKNENYYLTGEAAIFELGAKFYFNNVLKNNRFIQFSNTDFVKSLIVEGCGIDHTSSDTSFILHHNEETKVNKDSRLHLMGGASLCSFMAYHTKNVLYPKVLPLKYFTMGRQYTPSQSDEDSLFHVSQSSVIEVFGVTKTSNHLDELRNEVTDILKSIYADLGYHFRLVTVPAEKLQMWESLRVAVEMYSTSLDCYIEVGNISLSGDFISKRLLFTYVEDKVNKFPHILSGTVLNVPKFLGCILEQDDDFQVPDLFKVENWSFS